ncbi:LysE family translocator [Nitrogeniibacter aestuarii]|uniref:LysE family translocator n=1 Tax=Nitrogeniibacter aestuarii TaxID=2815343 RepID=UPI001D115A8D|nr:LysE family translocator [Nitrogeniibacter aestuarii]
MTLHTALSFFLALFIFGITPGPGVFAVLGRALASGAGACVGLSLGMVVSDMLYLLFACLGLAAIASQWGEVFTVIRWAGAAYLIYLGVRLWRAPVVTDAPVAISRRDQAAGFVQGFLISASNPKVILFYMAFLPTFMDLSALDALDVILALGLSLVALMLALMSIALGAARARRLLSTPRAAQRLNRGAGSIMIGAGVFLATRR